MENSVKQRLEQCKIEMAKCNEEFKKILEELTKLDSNKNIEEYNKLKLHLNILAKKNNLLIKEYNQLNQSECKHPLWYFLRDETDSYEQRQLWLCRCVKCRYEAIDHSRRFQDKLIIESFNMGFGELCKSSYEEVQNEYINLESNNVEENEIVKRMIKKYNNQNVKKAVNI